MEDNTKTCGRCKTNKPLAEFNKSKRGTHGVHGHCRQCQKEFRRRWYLEHRESEIEKHRSPEAKLAAKLHRAKKYREDHVWREATLKQNRERRRLEPARRKARKQRKRWYSIPENKLACALRGRIQKAMTRGTKLDSTEKLTGCTFSQLKVYIESKFSPGMSWDNYGEWHIDHVIPCKFFDLSKPEHQVLCFNFNNLQPMWARENQSKGTKITIDNLDGFLKELKAQLNR